MTSKPLPICWPRPVFPSLDRVNSTCDDDDACGVVVDVSFLASFFFSLSRVDDYRTQSL